MTKLFGNWRRGDDELEGVSGEWRRAVYGGRIGGERVWGGGPCWEIQARAAWSRWVVEGRDTRASP